MAGDELKNLEALLNGLYEQFDEERREAIESLGKEKSLHIIDYHANNWIDLVQWIFAKYEREEQTSMFHFQFLRLFKEIYWLQFLFLACNYQVIYRNLRYLLEMMAQAYYVDWKHPDADLDKQFEEIMDFEENCYGWRLVEHILSKILKYSSDSYGAYGISQDDERNIIINNYKGTWKYLNKHAHPSARQMSIDLVSDRDFSNLMTDSFSKESAQVALEAVDAIFDMIYAIVFKKYSRIRNLALDDKFITKWEIHSPITVRILRGNGRN